MKEYVATFNRPELLDRLVLKEESFDLEKDIGKRKEVCRKLDYRYNRSFLSLFSKDYLS